MQGERERLELLLQEENSRHEAMKELKEQEKALPRHYDPELWQSNWLVFQSKPLLLICARQRRELQLKGEALKEGLMVRQDALGQKAIHLAARYADVETFQLLAQVEPLRSRDFLGRLPLHRAAESGDAELLKAVMAFYEPQEIVEELDFKRHSALDLAVLSGSVEAVEALGSGASQGNGKRTALHLAAQWNHPEAIEVWGGSCSAPFRHL